MSEEGPFPPDMGQEVSGCKSFLGGWFVIAARCVTLVDKLIKPSIGRWAWLVGLQSTLFWYEIRRVMILPLEVFESTDFFELLLTVLLSRSDRNFGRKSSWLVEKKKDLFNCKFKITFQPDGCAATSFIHFGFGHCLDNIQLMLTFFNWNVRSLCFYLFIYSFYVWVCLECISKSEGIF